MSDVTRPGDPARAPGWDRAPASVVTVAVVDAEVVVRGIAAMLDRFDEVEVVEPAPTTAVDLLLVDADLLDGTVGPGPTWPAAAEAMARGHVRRLVALSWLPPGRAGTVGPSVWKRCDAAELRDRLVELALEEPTDEVTVTVAPHEAVVDLPQLPRREREVLVLIAEGATTDEIAARLGLSANTVKTYTRRLFRRIGVANRTRAALVAHRMGLVAPDDSA